MTFWLAVAVAYALLGMVGVALGVALAHRWPGDGRGRWDIPETWPQPDGGRQREHADR